MFVLGLLVVGFVLLLFACVCFLLMFVLIVSVNNVVEDLFCVLFILFTICLCLVCYLFVWCYFLFCELCLFPIDTWFACFWVLFCLLLICCFGCYLVSCGCCYVTFAVSCGVLIWLLLVCMYCFL